MPPRRRVLDGLLLPPDLQLPRRGRPQLRSPRSGQRRQRRRRPGRVRLDGRHRSPQTRRSPSTRSRWSDSDEASFEFSGSDPGGSGVASYRMPPRRRLPGGCSASQDLHSLAEGAHSFEVRAIDKAGNVDGAPADFDWTVDTTPPAVGIDSGPAGLPATPRRLRLPRRRAGGQLRMLDDTGTPDLAPARGSSETPEGPLADGAHSFDVRAIDEAGNRRRHPGLRSRHLSPQAPD